MSWRIGVDSGGTFTDVCLFDETTGRSEIWKVPSTPDDPSRGIVHAVVEGLRQVGAEPTQVCYFGHGTTVATNALIQLRGVKTGLIATDGFRDLLDIGRQKRPSLYDLQADKPKVLVPRGLRFEVPERVHHDGRIETRLDEQSVREVGRALHKAGVQAIAVCFLYSFIHPEHEQAVRRILAEECPDAFISISCEVAPEFREYERMSTAVVNAYLGPVMQNYIRRLAQRLGEIGVPAVPHLTQSNGGVIGFEQAARLPVRTLLSGPSTGVVAAQAIGEQLGIGNLITFDVGGTSSDVALLQNGQCPLASQTDVHGYPIKAPMLDIHTVGAGGGSIAYVDHGGLLKVGPRSAGADPGPVCYERGNTEPTVTDANVVLQTLNPTHLLGGRMPINRTLALDAIAKLAQTLGLGVMETAQGIISVVIANMARAIRVISVQRGHDPRDYALLAFGGAGPLHAARLAKELDIRRIVIPRNPGTACATGLLLTDLRADFSNTQIRLMEDIAITSINTAFSTLESQAQDWFTEEHIANEDRILSRSVDLRYLGQNYEISIPVPDGPISADSLNAMRMCFAQEHTRLYGFSAENDPIQLVTCRTNATGRVCKTAFTPTADANTNVQDACIGHRKVWMPEFSDFIVCPVFDRILLESGHQIQGPAVVEQMDSTTIVLPGMSARVEPYLNLILEFNA